MLPPWRLAAQTFLFFSFSALADVVTEVCAGGPGGQSRGQEGPARAVTASPPPEGEPAEGQD